MQNSIEIINQAIRPVENLPCMRCSRSPGLGKLCESVAAVATNTALDIMRMSTDTIDGGPEHPRRFTKNPVVIAAVREACLKQQEIKL